MYCTNCGTKLLDEDKFCYKCGEKVDSFEENDCIGGTNIKDENLKKQPENHNKTYVLFLNRPWLMPLFSFIFSGIIIFCFYGYELNVNNSVESMRIEAENLALQGKIKESEALIDKALTLRPNNKTLQGDKKFLKDGQLVYASISSVDGFVKAKEYNKAIEELEKAEGGLRDKEGSFYAFLKKNIEDKKTGVTIIQTKSDMNNKNTVEELAALLSKISAYNVKEAKDTEEELKNKISILCYNKANEFLKKNDFESSLNAIEQGLKYAMNDKKLTSFKDTISKEKVAFEKAEQSRIEQAMVSAAKEDKDNRTNAVQIIEADGSLSNYGDFIVKGKIKNIATKPISSVKIYYSVYDENNNELAKDYTYVYPDYLNINDSAEFQNIQYGVKNGHHIKISNITWYLR